MPAVGTQLDNARREKTRLLIVPRWLVISTPWLYPDRFVHCLLRPAVPRVHRSRSDKVGRGSRAPERSATILLLAAPLRSWSTMSFQYCRAIPVTTG